jgi:tryptophan 2,3-dioxygenase
MASSTGYGAGGDAPLNYDEYLKVPQLIALQQCRSNPTHHDEMLFIIIHQAYELWFRLILHECDRAIVAMNDDDPAIAERHLSRVIEIWRVLVPQIHILETMLPSDFLAFRDHLKPASGFQSAQFREIEFLAGLKDKRVLEYFREEPAAFSRLEQRLASPGLGDAFYALLAQRGYAVNRSPAREDTEQHNEWCESVSKELLKIYNKPSENYELFRLAERLVDFDEYISLWRFHHIRMVERMIGAKMGTGGSEGVGYLMRTLTSKCFPELWQVRTHIAQTGS